MHRTAGFLALAICLVASTCWALYQVLDRGDWPSTWPQELEVLRKSSRTLVGPMVENRHYAIPFTDREQFEKLWPLLLSVKTKDAPVILVRGRNFFLGDGVTAGVVVHTPPIGQDKNPRTPEAPINSSNFRQLMTHTMYIELVVDGDIVDLNRIDLSTVVVDERFKEPPLDKKTVLIPEGLDIVNRLRDALKSGTPREKESALEMIRALKPISLIPEIIQAIEDPTALPDHSTPDCKTGWVFVGHQAASVLAELARAIDGVEVGMQPSQRSYRSFSFHEDLESGDKMQKAGRLFEVRKNWQKWWDATQK